jgi:hypothetical protein
LLPALEKRYVNKVVFGVYDATKMEGDQLSADALLESYTFKFGSISEGDYIKVSTPVKAELDSGGARSLQFTLLTSPAPIMIRGRSRHSHQKDAALTRSSLTFQTLICFCFCY